jgi:hypothetical protein
VITLAAPLGRRLSLTVQWVLVPGTAPLLTESGEFLLVEGSAVQTLEVEAMLRGRAQETVSITRRRVFPLVP